MMNMEGRAMRRFVLAALLSVALVLTLGLSTATAGKPDNPSCWGAVTAIGAKDGGLGEHASSFETPRLGLRNLARDLNAEEIIPDDSMQALAQFVASAEGFGDDFCDNL
jgi:hypothetical protein